MKLTDEIEAPDAPGLYVFIFPNGKRYVGMSRKSVRVRVFHHMNAARAGRTKVAVRAALAKYGPESVSVAFPAFAGCPLVAERALIADYRSRGITLYNMTDGGEGTTGFQHRAEVRSAMSDAARKSWTAERRQRASEKRCDPALRARVSASIKASWNESRKADMARSLRARWAKLTEADAIAIAERLRSGETCASLGRAFNVTPEAINHIKHGKNWAHVTGIARSS